MLEIRARPSGGSQTRTAHSTPSFLRAPRLLSCPKLSSIAEKGSCVSFLEKPPRVCDGSQPGSPALTQTSESGEGTCRGACGLCILAEGRCKSVLSLPLHARGRMGH